MPSWAWIDVVDVAGALAELPAEVAEHRAALAGRQGVERRRREVEHHGREQGLVATGPGHLEVGLLEQVAGVVEAGLVVDLVVELELLERALQHLRRPPADGAEDEVGRRPRHDQPGELVGADGVDGGVAERGVDRRGRHRRHHAADHAAVHEGEEDRQEQQRGDDLDRVDAARVHHERDHPEHRARR